MTGELSKINTSGWARIDGMIIREEIKEEIKSRNKRVVVNRYRGNNIEDIMGGMMNEMVVG